MNPNRPENIELSDVISLLYSPSPEDIALITKAHDFAKEAHKEEKRFSGEPYFVHLINTAYNLAELGMGAKTIAAGFLHDSIEDVAMPPETIKKEFGDEILFLVEGVTKLGKVRYRGAERHNESLRKLFVATSRDVRVLIIKLADRLHNIGTLKFVRPEKQERIAKETLEIYAPIAYRLGIRKLSRSLEDLAFPYAIPEEYQKMKEILKAKKKETKASLDKFMKSLKRTLAENELTNIHTSHRTKGLYSLYRKLQIKKGDIDRIFDINAVRIIVDDISDCYKVLGIIHASWRPLPGRIKDYIAFPKPNGYKSIHTTIFVGDGTVVEIQIKTKEMHMEAEYGIASHISYKEGRNGDNSKGKKRNAALQWIQYLLPKTDVKDKLKDEKNSSEVSIPNWIKDLVEYQNQNKDNDIYKEDLQADVLKDRIFVFTPHGDVVDLPIGSCALDFAYTIHSEIGHHAVGAVVNRKYKALHTELKNGDIVEIKTKSNEKPNKKWLNFVKTTLAKRHIRSYLNIPTKKN